MESTKLKYIKINGKRHELIGGLSAYDLAVQQGFVGTVDDWLASLKGKDADVDIIELADTLGGDDEDKAPSVKAVNAGLESKVNRPKQELNNGVYGTGDTDPATSKPAPKMYTVRGTGTADHLAQFGPVDAEYIWPSPEYLTHTLGGADPLFPSQYATKGYSDKGDAELDVRLKVTERAVDNVQAAAEGRLYRTEIVDSVEPYNSVIPEDALPYAMIEKLGCLMYSDAPSNVAHFLIDELKEANPWVDLSKINVDYADGDTSTIRLTGTLEGTMLEIPISPFTISDEGVPLSVSLTGSWSSSWGGPMICALLDTTGNYLLAGEMQLTGSPAEFNTTLQASQYAGQTITRLILNLAVDALTFADCCISIMATKSSTNSAPVEHISTPFGGMVWEAPRTVLAMEEYGLGINGTCYNFIDFQRKVLVVNCKRDPSGALLKCDAPYEIDLSEFISDDDAIFATEGSMYVYFGFSRGGENMVLPHKIRYQVKVV